MKNKFIVVTLSSLLVLVGVLSFANVSVAQTSSVTSAPPQRALEISMSTDKKTYTPGETVVITIKATNVGQSDITLNFSSAKQTDYVINDKFRYSSNKMYAEVLSNVTLTGAGGQYTWTMRHTSGDLFLATGQNTITAEVVGYGSAATTINVSDSSTSPSPKYFRYFMAGTGHYFVVKATNSNTIYQITKDLTNKRLIVTGVVRSGNGGFNSPWGFHLDPGTIALAETTIELCDANPQYVQDNLKEWIGKIWCPWGARPDAVYDAPPVFLYTDTSGTGTMTSSIQIPPPTPTPISYPNGGVSSAQVFVNADVLNVRSDASIDSVKIDTVSRGEVLQRLDARGGWIQIQTDGGIGWVSSTYVSDASTAPASSSTREAQIAQLQTLIAQLIAQLQALIQQGGM